jgi:UDP-3-O-[3-hydroxymyristoyl] glucosamine N-acyltransferase
MVDSRFFHKQPPTQLKFLAALSGCTIADEDGEMLVHDVASLEDAGALHVSFFDNVKYKTAFSYTKAGFCIAREKYATLAPQGMRLLISTDPYRAYAHIATYFYPPSIRAATITPSATIASTARIGIDCHIAPHVVIGEHVIIGDGCAIDANTVIDDGVIIGKNTRIGALCSLSHCIIGDDVLLHRGVHIGQDGFGFAMGAGGHVKVPQLGRVIIGNNVEIGSGTTIDRGASPDTIIGEGSRIDNLVQIGHNVQLGKHVVMAAQCGVAGSTKIHDYAVLAGQVGVAGHLTIGAGAILAAKSGVTSDIPAGQTYGGIPAVPVKDWHRSHIQLKRLSTLKKTAS